ncbi:MAG: ThiF family adenylyltransferase [Anaerolineae bacterium]
MHDLSRYARQVVFPGIGEDGQRRLLAARVTIVGVGATGTVLANNLARAGVGALRLVDRDYVEWHNLQRQTLFGEAEARAGIPKAIAAAEHLRRVNSEIAIEPVVADVTAENVEALVADADVVMDGTDNFETRYLLNDICVKLGKPWVYTGVVSSYGMTMTVVPGETPCLRCLYPQPTPGGGDTCDIAGVLNGAAGVLASLASVEALKLIVGQGTRNAGVIHMDVWNNSYDAFQVARRPDCPACGRREFPFLDASADSSVSLCGRDAVQVRPAGRRQLDLAALGARLAAVGNVQVTPYLLRLTVNGHELTVFPDARAIIKGTDEPSVARSLYAKYIGM